MAVLGKPIVRMRALKEGEKRLTLLILKDGSFRYRFEPELWAGKDAKQTMKILWPAYIYHKRTLAKKEVKKDGDR